MKKTEAYMPRPGHTCRVVKPGDPWHRREVAVTAASRTGKSSCALWSAVGPALASPLGSVKRARIVYRDFMPSELKRVDLGKKDPWEPKVGKSYCFVREGHGWTGCEVIVIGKAERGYRVTRCSWMAEWLFGKAIGVKEPKSWTAYKSELC